MSDIDTPERFGTGPEYLRTGRIGWRVLVVVLVSVVVAAFNASLGITLPLVTLEHRDSRIPPMNLREATIERALTKDEEVSKLILGFYVQYLPDPHKRYPHSCPIGGPPGYIVTGETWWYQPLTRVVSCGGQFVDLD